MFDFLSRAAFKIVAASLEARGAFKIVAASVEARGAFKIVACCLRHGNSKVCMQVHFRFI